LDRNSQKREIEKLFKENYSRLYYYALNMIRDPENAKDMVSDAFHYVWEHYDGKVDPSLSVIALLHVRVKNSCIDYIRHQDVLKRYEEYILNDATRMNENDYYSEREERMAKVMDSIEKLPPQTKNVFKMCFLDGKKYKEVSAEMSISVNTIKTHIMKALRLLRDEFDNEDEFL
jgi:RNA polymerase sigma-70 factor (family 1)